MPKEVLLTKLEKAKLVLDKQIEDLKKGTLKPDEIKALNAKISSKPSAQDFNIACDSSCSDK